MLLWTILILLPFATDRIAADFDWDTPTALDDYVQMDDGFHSWTELDMYEYQGVDIYILNMTSQKWMDETFTSRSVWWHWMGIAIPHDIEVDDVATLGLIGGSNSDTESYPLEDDLNNQVLAWYANNSKIVSAYILQVPNQPQVFVNDPEQDEKSEDNWIAWTWVEAERVNGTVPEMVARMPMTKAGKRGLDTINQFVLSKTGANINRFIVGGASKRGWSTWSLAATDQRVIGITPLVFSLLNMGDVLMHHYRTMDGGWSFAFGPYWNVNLTLFLLDPLADVLYDYEDMYRYKPRLTMPKLIISASGDEFFFLSDSHYWWNDIPGENRFMMNPNAEHILFPHWLAIARNIVVFTKALIRDESMPQVSWERTQEDGGGRIAMMTNIEPLEVRGFRGETLNNHTRRDFRLFVNGDDGVEPQPVVFTREEVTEIPVEEGYRYELYNDEVDDVWVGQFIQAEFEGLDDFDFRFTTEVNVIPDTFPRDACTTGEECYGYLV